MSQPLFTALEAEDLSSDPVKLAGALSALSETLVDMLSTGTLQDCQSLVESLKVAYRRMLTRDPELDEHGPQYLLGRLGSCLEISALASQRYLSAAFVESVLSPQNTKILQLLVDVGEKRNIDLAREMGKSPDVVSRQLKDLAAKGIVVQRRVGREVTNRLSLPSHQILAKAEAEKHPVRQTDTSFRGAMNHDERWTWDTFARKVDELADMISEDKPDAIIGISHGGQTVADRLQQRMGNSNCRTFTLNAERSEMGTNFDIPANKYVRDALKDMPSNNPLLVDDKCCSGMVLESAKKFITISETPGGIVSIKTAVVAYAKNHRIKPTYFSFEMHPKGKGRGVLLPTSARWRA